MKKFLIAGAVLLSISAAKAEDKNPTISDLEFNQRAVVSLQAQRNAALDNLAAAEAKLTAFYAQLQASNAKIKELEEKLKSEVPPQKK